MNKQLLPLITNRLLESAKESPPKRVAEAVGDDSNNSFVVLKTYNENNSDRSYQPRSDGLMMTLTTTILAKLRRGEPNILAIGSWDQAL
ncbi:21943_t:CDS:2 [Dentiscutata erythropus]|uniref:21943_t:CDS:1 n=1 Tax=Dentiscutata erythropus TaxID=1348616 RepID=A0A9N8ZIY8_9GLOM|nr:21943_t:CDS:2 [Dentiscutata erythropus]